MVTQTQSQGWLAWTRSERGGIALLTCIAGAVVFGLLAFASVEFTRADSRIAAVWVPNALAVAYMLRFRIAYEHVFVLALWIGNTVANVAGGDPIANGAALAACNAIEIQIAVALTRYWCDERPDMQDISQLLYFLGAAAVVAPMVSATLATLTLGVSSSVFMASWLKWAVTDGLGMAVFGPSAMVLIDAARNPSRLSSARLAEWFGVVLGGAGITVALFLQPIGPVLFLTAPIVLLHAFRLGAAGTAVGMMITAAISIFQTSAGQGPISQLDSSLTAQLIVLQTYIASSFLMGLPISALLEGRKRAMSDLAAKRKELELLADTITDAVLHYDRSGLCTYVSLSAESVLRTNRGTLFGTQPIDLAHSESHARLTQTLECLWSGESHNERITFRLVRDDETGRARYIEADCAVAQAANDEPLNGIVISARDVTERVELEMQLTRARRVAEEAARGKSEFLANMSHEIRTPMNGVLGFAELLSQADLPAEHQHQAELIVQSGRSMMMLLNDILDLAKIEAGHVNIERESVDLGDLIKECTRLHQASAQNKGLSLTCDGPERGPFIFTDGLRLRQILLNLLSNAVKFTELGSITLRHSIRDDQVMIEVEDTGIGILAERIGNIFEPFEQGENDTSRRYGGTGLGLTISRQLAELLGGQLDVASKPGEGSRFTVRIPYQAAERKTPAEPLAVPVDQEVNAAQLQPSHILLAEDHDINRALVTAMLERCGQNVTIARDGEEAIEAVMEAHSMDRPFDLVLMDIQMPGCDGYSATRAIRAEGIRASQLPIIALTANAYPEDIVAAREAGMQGHLAKPLAFAGLVQALQRWLPVRIVDDLGQQSGASSSPGAASPATVNSPSLLERWKTRRLETLNAVNAAVQDETLAGDQAIALAKLVHTLSGTAGMFGEAKLGECAAKLERALKSDVSQRERRALAEELLDAAKHGTPQHKRLNGSDKTGSSE